MVLDDRAAAGRELAERLRGHAGGVVLGLPRGGVVVAAAIAERLGAPLDVVLVRKVGAPDSPELALGAVGEDGVVVGNPAVLRHFRPSARIFAHAAAEERAALEQRAERYRAARRIQPVAGRTVILVDDGIATGATVRAATAVLRARGAGTIVLAVPVAPPQALATLSLLVDEIVCLTVPRRLRSVSQCYADFSEVGDDEVLALLRRFAGVPA
ncbi:phosphoribosyltransferase [Amycolatopsis acidicola]|uniref:Phosphoribosyltransferase n=1 Tax=Amycolatopsis acidicola TaxID=2596893 RepID=A0A5N0UNG7_9PSEU|nr:phosphoribosyltransferase family protein [Amycolatopsis acidicola]KAA9152161.1 phosphoribosyltransferase [Amycolatopsis acidicola]